MKKKNKHKTEGFDEAFDKGTFLIDFSHGFKTQGLSASVKLPPLAIPAWLAGEIDSLSKIQANSKASIIRQLLVEAVLAKQKAA